MDTELLEAKEVMTEKLPPGRLGAEGVASVRVTNPRHSLAKNVIDQFRCPDDFFNFATSGETLCDAGYFRFGSNATCYGRLHDKSSFSKATSSARDALDEVVNADGTVVLPFDPNEVIDNLRLERYADGQGSKFLRKIYYFLRPLMSLPIRKRVQQFHARRWQELAFPHWPVDTTVEEIFRTLLLLSLQAKGSASVPFIWFWPRGAQGCVLMTHDVETEAGRDFCSELIDIDDSYGIKAAFQIVPEERYPVPENFLADIRSRGFEIGIQDLNHDGRLFEDKKEFLRRAKAINQYGRRYRAQGFRAGVLYREPEWYGALDFSFDMSIPNVAHLDPQRGGCCTVMPYFIGEILELPVTTIQDYGLLHILNQDSAELWIEQIKLVLNNNGLVHFIVHPDYLIEPRGRAMYEELLAYLRDLRAKENLWFALPSDINEWWRARAKMSIVADGDSFRIEGECAEHAVLAFAQVENGRLVYKVRQAITQKNQNQLLNSTIVSMRSSQ